MGWALRLVVAVCAAVLAAPAGARVDATTGAATTGADLQVSVAGSAGGVAGEGHEFVYSLVNNGPETATNVVLSLTPPAEAQSWYVLGSTGCDVLSRPMLCTYASLASGETREVTWGMYLNTVGANTSTATVTSDTSDPSPSNNTDSDTITVSEADADPEVYLFGPDRGLVGDSLSYQLNIGNSDGPDQVYGSVTATITLPAEVSIPPSFGFAGSTTCSFGSGGSFSCFGGNPGMTCSYPGTGSRTFTCTLRDQRGIGPGASHFQFGSANFSVNGASEGTAAITATLSPTDGVVDNDGSNNTSTVSTRLFVGSIPPEADLRVTQTAPATIRPNRTFAYSVKVKNNGPDTANPVTVTSELPSNVTFQSATGGTCTGATTLTCDIGSLSLFQEKTLTINVLSGAVEGDATNTASASASPADLDPSNNTASATTAIHEPFADFEAVLTGPASSPRQNQTFQATLTVSNHGPDAGTGGGNVTLPEGVTYVSSTSPRCFQSGSTAFFCNTDTVAAGASQSFQVTLRATSEGEKTFAVRTTGSNPPDPNSANDNSSLILTVLPPPRADLSATLTGATEAIVDDTYTYRFTVANAGPDQATGLSINTYFHTAPFDTETATLSTGGSCAVHRNGGTVFDELGTIVVCSGLTLDAGASLYVDVTMRPLATGDFDIGGQASATQSDPTPGDRVTAFLLHVSPPPPTISCPAAISVSTDPGLATATVVPGDATTDSGTPPLAVEAARSDGAAIGDPYPIGTTTITRTVTDADGRTASCTQTVTVTDDEAPVTIATGAPLGWSQSPVTVNLAATDNSGSVEEIRYSTGGATTVDPGATADVLVDAEGLTTLTYYAVDEAGNEESEQTLEIRVDTHAPEVTCEGPDGSWHADNLSLACTAGDAVSGLADAADASFLLATNVPAGVETDDAETGSRSVCDQAGNCTGAGPIGGNMVDRKGPTITVFSPAQGAAFPIGTVVAADYECFDGASGLASCAGTIPDGAPLDTSAVGSGQLVVNATDTVGNPASTTVLYDVVYQLCVLFDQTRARPAPGALLVRLRPCDAVGNLVIRAVSIDDDPLPSPRGNPENLFRRIGDLYQYELRLPATLAPGRHLLHVAVSDNTFDYTIEFFTR